MGRVSDVTRRLDAGDPFPLKYPSKPLSRELSTSNFPLEQWGKYELRHVRCLTEYGS